MFFKPIFPQPDKNWSFDVSSLAVLVGDEQELRYRLSLRSFLQCITAAPVVGLQTYIRSYDILLQPGAFTYFNPSGCKSALLRNSQLENAINKQALLEDGRYTVYRIPEGDRAPPRTKAMQTLLLVWVVATWLILGGIIAFTILASKVTWVGITNVLVLTAWSIILRLVEYFYVRPAEVKESNVTDVEREDAVFILGRNNSGFVLEGRRIDMKNWTTRGLQYRNRNSTQSKAVKTFTRGFSLLILLFVFSTIPNGHTMDQLAFIILNGLAQANVLIGQFLNSSLCLSNLVLVEEGHVETRTHLYGNLVRRYHHDEQRNNWVEELGLLPKTSVWKEWKDSVITDAKADPKELYETINEAHKARRNPNPLKAPVDPNPVC